MEEGFDLDAAGRVGREDGPEEFSGGLDGAFGPAVLLGFEAVDFGGQLGGASGALQEDELPAGELGAVAEVHVFGEGVMLPTAGGFDGLFSPDAGGAVEVHPPAGAIAGGLFDDEVAVEEDRLGAGEHGSTAVEVIPADLDHADDGVGEVVDGAFEDAGSGDEVGVEYGDEVALGDFESGVEGTGLEADAVDAMDVTDIVPAVAHAAGALPGDVGALVGGIVEDLDFELIGGVVDVAGGLDDALSDEILVVHRELDGDDGEIGEASACAGEASACAVVEPDEPVAVEAVDADEQEDKQVGGGEGPAEGGRPGCDQLGDGRFCEGLDQAGHNRSLAGSLTGLCQAAPP